MVQARIQSTSPQVVLLDCSRISFVGSAGLAALVRVAKEAQRGGIRFSICGVRNQMATLLRFTSMEGGFEMFNDRPHFYIAPISMKSYAASSPKKPA